MGPTWDPSGADRTQVRPMLPELCYLGTFIMAHVSHTSLCKMHTCKTKIFQSIRPQLSWCLESPGTPLFVQQLVHANAKGDIKVPHYWPFMTGIHRWPADSPQKVPLTRAAFPYHDDVIKLNLFPRYWPFVRRIHQSPVNSPHKGSWRVALMFSLICDWTNRWVNNRDTDDLRHHRAHYDVTVMSWRHRRPHLHMQFLLCSLRTWGVCKRYTVEDWWWFQR